MSDKEPSFQEFFGLTDEEKEAFEEACEIAVSSDEKLEEEQNNRKITKDEDIVGLVAKQVMGVGEDSEGSNDKERTQKTDVAKRLNCSDEFVKIMAKELGLSEDKKDSKEKGDK